MAAQSHNPEISADDGAKAYETLVAIWRVCLNHLNPGAGPEASMSEIIRLLDPWPLSTPPQNRTQTDQ
jgi:hypothetical protein